MHGLGILDIGLLFVGTVTALYGPILLERVADRYAVTRTTLLGKKWSANNIENASLPIFATRLRAFGRHRNRKLSEREHHGKGEHLGDLQVGGGSGIRT